MDQDLKDQNASDGEQGERAVEDTRIADIETVLAGFDPGSNEIDRRILFEATRLKLFKDEFEDENSSESGDEPPAQDWLALEQENAPNLHSLNT
mmetsp:Transcript_20708/g.27953  ORF Transcript_20708/g.27953 Transcript_20708/m.27953 type:complete len:94 (+) Transcript_20708:1503-1784(+)|eukprot:CAMPEP_0185584342 /NCGR_PEP_ID=MMETSP0434-20130131/31624_1 /TAXON_ID=626734 ORGANISM="Favella taraikaensis, Strain Fe Narragansett Bay" /NCGR_SAMPLE_ID=MMETSP0434 /ASSEMBLY_ACC=CAM_ASM_000379 /LENGTH=93 /DNA_ID=CAMNT_0028204027 /DNA_START=1435 /DNA_END=1716 /DNA_ORIENTATION=-